MPRRQLVLAPRGQVPATRSLTASAAVLSGTKRNQITPQQNTSWQEQCYRHYRICGEARFAAQFFGHALSKTTLYISADPLDKTPVTSGTAFDLLNELFAGCEGQAAMLASIGVHFTIAGECYLIGRNEPDPDDTAVYINAPVDTETPDDYDIWEIRSILEVRRVGTNWQINPGGGRPTIDLDDSAVVIRMWTPDPAYAFNADSPFRSLIPILEEIEWLTQYVMAQCSSRLAAAGLLIFPEEIDFPPPPDSPTGENRGTMDDPSNSDQLMATLAYAMSEAIKDPSSPAAKVPITMTAPGEYIDKVKWINFWTQLDTETKNLRGEAIQRFALGMDLPPERILGMSSSKGTGGGSSNGVSHWGAWQIDEDTIKMHVEPMLDVVVQALSFSYIRPVTGDMSTVRYDTTALRLRPDRSAESLELYDRGLVKGSVAVTENGFKLEDMMDPEERALWLIVKIAGGSATPDMVSEALKKLGVNLPVGDSGQAGNAARPTPSLEGHPPPQAAPDPSTSALIAASEGLVFRALERAGNRLRQGGTKPPGVPSYETHTLMPGITVSHANSALEDAWPCAPQVLAGIADHAQVVPILNAYVTSLLTSQQTHSREALSIWLEKL